jgi:DNA-binding GntR family transcriptional regulator
MLPITEKTNQQMQLPGTMLIAPLMQNSSKITPYLFPDKLDKCVNEIIFLPAPKNGISTITKFSTKISIVLKAQKIISNLLNKNSSAPACSITLHGFNSTPIEIKPVSK